MEEPILNNDFQEPLPPENKKVKDDPPQMSEVASLGNIFFEPGRTFEDMRRKPRFILAWLLIIIFAAAFQILFIEKVGFENMMRQQIESSPRTEQLSKEDKEKIIQQQSSPVVKAITFAATPIIVIIFTLLGGLLYWLGANAMGGSAKFTHGLSAWVYSSFPPTILFMIANIIVLFLKTADDIDILGSRNGLVKANPSFFVDGKAHPVLSALLSGFDLFAIFGWILASIGLQKVAKISSGASWAIVLIIGLIGITARVIAAYFFG